jgi:hypothetical protein
MSGIAYFNSKRESHFPSMGFIDITLSKVGLSQIQDYVHLVQKLSDRKSMKNLLHQTDLNQRRIKSVPVDLTSSGSMTDKDINSRSSSTASTDVNINRFKFGTTPLDKLLIKKDAVYKILTFFKGLFYVGAVCYDPITSKEEIYDYNDIISQTNNIIEGVEIEIKNVKSSVEFKRIINGTFYKWQTTTGDNFILNQAEVDTLTKKEKRYLRIC